MSKLLPRIVLGCILSLVLISPIFLIMPVQAVTGTLDYQVTAATDNWGLSWNGGSWTLGSNPYVVNLGCYNASNFYKAGGSFRFNGIALPQGVTITAAYFTAKTDTSSSNDTVNASIVGLKVDNASAITDLTSYLNDRGTAVGGANNNYLTTSTVAWSSIGHWISGSSYQSPSIVSIVQEVVNRAGWASGNSMMFFIDDVANLSTASANTNRRVDGYGEGSADTLRLHIEYTLPVVVPTVTTQAGTSTLNGNVTNMGNADSVNTHFEYGSTTSYGTSTPTVAVAVTGVFTVSVPNALKVGGYHYRAVAANSAGTANGTDQTFTVTYNTSNSTFMPTWVKDIASILLAVCVIVIGVVAISNGTPFVPTVVAMVVVLIGLVIVMAF